MTEPEINKWYARHSVGVIVAAYTAGFMTGLLLVLIVLLMQPAI